MPTDPRTDGFTIPDDDTDGYSDAVNFNYLNPGGFDVPALEATTAKLLFEHCKTETGTFVPLKYDNEQISITVDDPTESFREQMDPGKLSCLSWVRIQAVNSSDAAVQQSTLERNVGIAAREFK